MMRRASRPRSAPGGAALLLGDAAEADQTRGDVLRHGRKRPNKRAPRCGRSTSSNTPNEYEQSRMKKLLGYHGIEHAKHRLDQLGLERNQLMEKAVRAHEEVR